MIIHTKPITSGPEGKTPKFSFQKGSQTQLSLLAARQSKQLRSLITRSSNNVSLRYLGKNWCMIRRTTWHWSRARRSALVQEWMKSSTNTSWLLLPFIFFRYCSSLKRLTVRYGDRTRTRHFLCPENEQGRSLLTSKLLEFDEYVI